MSRPTKRLLPMSLIIRQAPLEAHLRTHGKVLYPSLSNVVWDYGEPQLLWVRTRGPRNVKAVHAQSSNYFKAPFAGEALSILPLQVNRITVTSFALCVSLASFVALLFFSAPTTTQAQSSLTLVFPHPVAEEGQWAKFAEDLSNSDNELEYNVVLSPSFDNAVYALEALREGNADIAVISGHQIGNVIAEFGFLDLPFVLYNTDQARRVVDELQQVLGNAANSRKLQVLGYTWGVGTFISTGGCIGDVDDIQGKTILGTLPQYKDIIRSIGAQPIYVNQNDIVQALEIGYADTGLFSIDKINDEDFSIAGGCVTDPRDFSPWLIPHVIVADLDRWNDYDDDLKSALQSDMVKLGTSSDAYVDAATQSVLSKFKKYGKGVSEFETSQLQDLRKLAEPLYVKYRTNVHRGQEILDGVLAIHGQ